jgi:Ala-tRNA(Pro) deacylase
MSYSQETPLGGGAGTRGGSVILCPDRPSLIQSRKTMSNKTHPLPKKVDDLLKKSGVKFELLSHKTVFTAYDKAATLKARPTAVAKVLVLKLDKELAVAVIPADRNLDVEKIKKAAKAEIAGFVKEKAVQEAFKGIDPGAIPPFFPLWGYKVFADKLLLKQPKIIFSAGSYEWSARMTPGAFKKINPDMVIGTISKAKEKKVKVKSKQKTKTKIKPKKAMVGKKKIGPSKKKKK